VVCLTSLCVPAKHEEFALYQLSTTDQKEKGKEPAFGSAEQKRTNNRSPQRSDVCAAYRHMIRPAYSVVTMIRKTPIIDRPMSPPERKGPGVQGMYADDACANVTSRYSIQIHILYGCCENEIHKKYKGTIHFKLYS
jgi:hypothetical protein